MKQFFKMQINVRTCLLSILAVMLIGPNICSAHGQNPKEIEILRNLTLQELSHKKFFLQSSCRGIADFLLFQTRLPLLGKTTPIQGFRGTFDRTNTSSDYPIFSDEIKTSKTGKTKVKIRGQKNKEAWNLVWEHNFETEIPKKKPYSHKADLTNFKTEFKFKPLQAGLDKCPFVKMKVTLTPSFNQSSQNQVVIQKSLGLNECLDLFAFRKRIPELDVLRDPIAAEKYLRDVCVFAIHYSDVQNRQ